jgi:glycosyltransferase 2 family protein
MDRKRLLIYGGITVVLAALVYLQFRTWKNFDWPVFWTEWKHISPGCILAAVAFIYVSYYLRALRWKIFLRGIRKDVSARALLAPTVIGFTGLAILGRPGELIRPYLIAVRTSLSFPYQMAVWTVERIFDVGAFTVLLTFAIFYPGTALHSIAEYRGVQVFGLLFIALAAGLSFGAILVSRYGEPISAWVERRFSGEVGHRISQKLRDFHRGLDTIHGPRAFLEISAVSLVMWACIAGAYLEVVRSYGTSLQQLTFSKVFPLMGSSMVGSLIQLPGVGGGSQLGTISALQHIFNVSHELAANCGILLWLATFVSVVPVGLVLAQYERLSLRKLSAASQQAEDVAAVGPPAQ